MHRGDLGPRVTTPLFARENRSCCQIRVVAATFSRPPMAPYPPLELHPKFSERISRWNRKRGVPRGTSGNPSGVLQIKLIKRPETRVQGQLRLAPNTREMSRVEVEIIRHDMAVNFRTVIP